MYNFGFSRFQDNGASEENSGKHDVSGYLKAQIIRSGKAYTVNALLMFDNLHYQSDNGSMIALW